MITMSPVFQSGRINMKFSIKGPLELFKQMLFLHSPIILYFRKNGPILKKLDKHVYIWEILRYCKWFRYILFNFFSGGDGESARLRQFEFVLQVYGNKCHTQDNTDTRVRIFPSQVFDTIVSETCRLVIITLK